MSVPSLRELCLKCVSEYLDEETARGAILLKDIYYLPDWVFVRALSLSTMDAFVLKRYHRDIKCGINHVIVNDNKLLCYLEHANRMVSLHNPPKYFDNIMVYSLFMDPIYCQRHSTLGVFMFCAEFTNHVLRGLWNGRQITITAYHDENVNRHEPESIIINGRFVLANAPRRPRPSTLDEAVKTLCRLLSANKVSIDRFKLKRPIYEILS